MMASYLEDFGPDTLVFEGGPDESAAGEEQRLAIFEQGYSAGWEDALAAQARNTQVASEEFANNLNDLSFTYQEAVQHVVAGLVPFFEALAETLVPDALDAGFVQRIARQLSEAVGVNGAAEVKVRCSPSRQPLLSSALPTLIDMPVSVVTDAAFQDDAVSIDFETSQRHFDLSELSDHVRQSIDAFAFQTKKDRANG